MKASEYNTWIDENELGLTIHNYQDALVLDLYIEYENGSDNSMEFIFKNKEDLEEFINRLNYLKESIWP